MKNHINIFRIAAVVSSLLLAAMPGLRAQDVDTDDDLEVSVRYDIQKQFGLTASVATITAEELENVYDRNIAAALAGKLPGLTVMQTSGGSIEATPTLYVRGRSSFNTASPTVYVDGIRSSLSNLMLSEIETISVLKDAAALSLFGPDGADGIIYVTTKRGQEGKTKVHLTVRQGFQQATEIPDLVDSYTFASLYNEARSNDAGFWNPYYSESQLAAYKSGSASTIENYDLLYPNVNWFDEVIKPLAPATNAEASFSGGNKNLRYFAMAAYQGVQGLFAGTEKNRDTNSNLNDQKFNFRINVDANISKVFDLKANLAGTLRNQYKPMDATNTIWETLITTPANAFPVETPLGYGGDVNYTNPVANVLGKGWYNNHSRVVEANFTLGQNLDFITKGLRLEESIALYSLHQQQYQKSRTYQRFQPFLNADGELSYNTFGVQATDFTISDTGIGMNNMDNILQQEVTLRYNRTFGANVFNATATYHNDTETIEGLNQPLTTRGFAGRLGYGWNDKLFLEFDWSYMGKSAYNPSHSMGFFPSISAAYVFVKGDSSENVNLLKLRASAGLTGMADLATAANYYMYQQYYHSQAVGPLFNWTGDAGKSGLFEYYLANPDAEWETLHRANIGLDTRFFGDRLTMNVDAFYDHRTGILVSSNVPAYYGILSDSNINDGVVRNYGIEGALGWSDKIGDFRYGISGTFSFARNCIVNMNEAPTMFSYQGQTGKAIGIAKRYVADGFYQSQEEVDALPSLLGDVTAGDLKYKDLNNDGKIDAEDATYEGDFFSTIPEINYGFQITLGYKGIDFELSGYGMANRQINTYNILTRAFSNGLYNVSPVAEGRWAYYPEQGIDTRSTATYPRLTLGSNSNNASNSTFWIKNGNLMRINNISLGYSLPEKVAAKLRAEKVRLYLAVINPMVFDNVYGDAECPVNYPLMRTYKIGLNLNF